MAGSGVPDLQSILATLSQFTSQPAAAQFHENDGVKGSRSVLPQSTLLNDVQDSQHVGIETPPPESHQSEDPRPRPQAQSVPKPKTIDPATITNWQEGIRCVTKIAAQNAHFAVALRKMMEEQRRHEMLWYKERQALKQTQMARASSSAQAMSILHSLGSQASGSAASDMPEVNSTTELADHDRKVYAAQQRMELAMISELKALGVPFFGTDENLVVPDTTSVPSDQSSERRSKTITAQDLLDLQRKMIGHLEDLYRD
nr:hypothetical protein CFP56_21808 [Quercus suber]